MAHPSIERAREILANREQKEAEHARWQADHADELSDARLQALRQKKVMPADWSTRPMTVV
jgi:hypothetical protein